MPTTSFFTTFKGKLLKKEGRIIQIEYNKLKKGKIEVKELVKTNYSEAKKRASIIIQRWFRNRSSCWTNTSQNPDEKNSKKQKIPNTKISPSSPSQFQSLNWDKKAKEDPKPTILMCSPIREENASILDYSSHLNLSQKTSEQNQIFSNKIISSEMKKNRRTRRDRINSRDPSKLDITVTESQISELVKADKDELNRAHDRHLDDTIEFAHSHLETNEESKAIKSPSEFNQNPLVVTNLGKFLKQCESNFLNGKKEKLSVAARLHEFSLQNYLAIKLDSQSQASDKGSPNLSKSSPKFSSPRNVRQEKINPVVKKGSSPRIKDFIHSEESEREAFNNKTIDLAILKEVILSKENERKVKNLVYEQVMNEFIDFNPTFKNKETQVNQTSMKILSTVPCTDQISLQINSQTQTMSSDENQKSTKKHILDSEMVKRNLEYEALDDISLNFVTSNNFQSDKEVVKEKHFNEKKRKNLELEIQELQNNVYILKTETKERCTECTFNHFLNYDFFDDINLKLETSESQIGKNTKKECQIFQIENQFLGINLKSKDKATQIRKSKPKFEKFEDIQINNIETKMKKTQTTFIESDFKNEKPIKSQVNLSEKNSYEMLENIFLDLSNLNESMKLLKKQNELKFQTMDEYCLDYSNSSQASFKPKSVEIQTNLINSNLILDKSEISREFLTETFPEYIKEIILESKLQNVKNSSMETDFEPNFEYIRSHYFHQIQEKLDFQNMKNFHFDNIPTKNKSVSTKNPAQECQTVQTDENQGFLKENSKNISNDKRLMHSKTETISFEATPQTKDSFCETIQIENKNKAIQKTPNQKDEEVQVVELQRIETGVNTFFDSEMYNNFILHFEQESRPNISEQNHESHPLLVLHSTNEEILNKKPVVHSAEFTNSIKQHFVEDSDSKGNKRNQLNNEDQSVSESFDKGNETSSENESISDSHSECENEEEEFSNDEDNEEFDEEEKRLPTEKSESIQQINPHYEILKTDQSRGFCDFGEEASGKKPFLFQEESQREEKKYEKLNADEEEKFMKKEQLNAFSKAHFHCNEEYEKSALKTPPNYSHYEDLIANPDSKVSEKEYESQNMNLHPENENLRHVISLENEEMNRRKNLSFDAPKNSGVSKATLTEFSFQKDNKPNARPDNFESKKLPKIKEVSNQKPKTNISSSYKSNVNFSPSSFYSSIENEAILTIQRWWKNKSSHNNSTKFNQTFNSNEKNFNFLNLNFLQGALNLGNNIDIAAFISCLNDDTFKKLQLIALSMYFCIKTIEKT